MVFKVLFAGIAVSALALAQGGMGGGGGGMGGGGGSTMGSAGREQNGAAPSGNMGRPQKESKGTQIVNRLKLNKDQVTEFGSIMNATAKDADPVVVRFLQARNMLATAMISGKTGADLDPLVKALADSQTQMTGMELAAFQKIVAILKPNQVAKAPEAFELMAGIFEPQPTGAGRGGGGGRGMGGGGR
jgi:hypothetical protein